MQAKKLTLLDATLLVSGSMIGSGVFIVAADMTRQVGSSGWLLLAWVLTGLMTLMAALAFGEMSSMYPQAGGQYNYISKAWGKGLGFVYGWSVFTVIQTGVIAAVAMAFAKYLAVIFPGISGVHQDGTWFGEGHAFLGWIRIDQTIAIGSILLLTLINSRGIQESKWVQRIFTLAKLLALFAIIGVGIYCAQTLPVLRQNLQDMWSASSFNGSVWLPIGGIALASAFSGAMVGSLFSSDAWQGLTFMSNEIERPERTIPKALVLGTGIVTLVYCLTQVAYMSILPLKGDSSATSTVMQQGIAFAELDRVGAAAASGFMGNAHEMGPIFMAILIVISTFGCNNGLILAGSRLFRAMASQGYFLAKAEPLNRHGVPGNALWMQAIWSSVLCLSGSYGELLEYCTFASLLFYVVTVLGLFRLRKREPQHDRPYKTWGYPIIPAIYCVLAFAICIGILSSKFESSLKGLFLVALGFPIYHFLLRKKLKS